MIIPNTPFPPGQVFANIAIIVMDEESPAVKDWFTWRDGRGPWGQGVDWKLRVSCVKPALTETQLK